MTCSPIPVVGCTIALKLLYLYLNRCRRVIKVDIVENGELLVIMSGKQPMVKLLPRSALAESEDGDIIKIPETKGFYPA